MEMELVIPEGIFKVFSGPLVLYQESHIWFYRIQTVLILTTGTLLLMWLGEQITERGIGNGVSLVITIGIVADLPGAFQAVFYMFSPPAGVETRSNLFFGVFLVALLVLGVAS